MPKWKTTADLNVRAGPGTQYEILDVLKEGDVIAEVMISPDWCALEMEDESIAWVSRKYLKVREDISPGPAPSVEPVWIRWARKQIGQEEVPGPASNPVIQAWYHLTTLPEEFWTDKTAWCAVFVNAALMLSNIETIRSARAFDWLNWGRKVTIPQKGDVVVFDFSHVAFYINDAGDGKINCLGGNQSDSVNITAYKKSSVKGYRRPHGY